MNECGFCMIIPPFLIRNLRSNPLYITPLNNFELQIDGILMGLK